ncbi:MAG TPA: TetR/AcrR family transcriptional regulator [Thermomicrobiales bacterium]|nr:TetR/AcrR family transcriptional regulator [Thermomicrobiales bacterium]
MGRPKVHDERTALALLAAAERLVAEDGLEALSVRRVAGAAGTTTRAVYSLFGSKEGLVVALGVRAFDLLRAALEALPATDDPAGDLVEAGAVVFRRFVLEHPALFRLGVQHVAVPADLAQGFRAAAEHALDGLQGRVARLADAQRLGACPPREAGCAFHALCEGLAALELRGALPRDAAERVWRDALAALVAGWGAA